MSTLELIPYDPEWDPADYRIEIPDITYTGPLVDMPLIGKVVRVHEADKCLAVEAEVAPLFSCLAAVDYLAGFCAGRPSTRSDYVGFLGTYFPSAYRPLSKWIYYDLRCGLMHNLVAMNPWRTGFRPYRIGYERESHLAEVDGTLHFSVSTFLTDVGRSSLRFAHHLIMRSEPESPLIENFHKRFNRLGGAAYGMARE
jgi:hypothetical protein